MPAMLKSDAAPPEGDVRIRLRKEVYDALANAKNLRHKAARAQLHGLDRAHFGRIYEGDRVPTLRTAMRIAADLGTTVDALFVREPAV